jgi:hypothetical protein
MIETEDILDTDVLKDVEEVLEGLQVKLIYIAAKRHRRRNYTTSKVNRNIS